VVIIVALSLVLTYRPSDMVEVRRLENQGRGGRDAFGR
jgi:hypothetical protein